VKALALTLALALAGTAQADRGRIREVTRWAYQLQGELPRPGAEADLLVIDPDGNRAPVTPRQLERLKSRPGRPGRIVLAYLSIGEAENYRSYWKSSWSRRPPPFIAGENRHWRGNFKVRYWSPEWQAIVLQAIDRIVDAGYDGAYLDIIDAFEYFAPDGPKPERRSAADDMAAFVERLARHARVDRKRPDFLIVPQNGATILDRIAPAHADDYLATVDAIGAEDAFYSGKRGENNPLHPDEEMLAALERFRRAGKAVLSVEYVTLPDKIHEYLKLAAQHGFAACFAPRELDHLIESKE